MKERPIIFSGPMVKAILEGRKTKTRRIVKGAEKFPEIVSFHPWIVDDERQMRESGVPLWVSTEADGTTREWGCPYGLEGDRLWVKETWGIGQQCKDGPDIWYKATEERCAPMWKSSMFMPRAYSRITLEICSVRVERLQEISPEDAQAEGCSGRYSKDSEGIKEELMSPEEVYAELWESIHGAGAWELNPWVWVIEFNSPPLPEKVSPGASKRVGETVNMSERGGE